jgi:hypothetical protein
MLQPDTRQPAALREAQSDLFILIVDGRSNGRPSFFMYFGIDTAELL